MAFSTLATIRTRLNAQLGIADGDTEPWGGADARSTAIRYAFEQLEPTMMRLQQEDHAVVEDAFEYTLTSITKVQLIEQLDDEGKTLRDLKNYRQWIVDDDPPVSRLRFANPLSTATSLVVTGYQPYVSDLTADADTCDLADELLWIPLLGATAELYRRRFHAWLDFERYNASNPSTTIDPAVLYRAYSDAQARFEEAMLEHTRKVSLPRRARMTRK